MKTSGSPPVKTITRTCSSFSRFATMSRVCATMSDVKKPFGGLVNVTVAMPPSILQSTVPMLYSPVNAAKMAEAPHP